MPILSIAPHPAGAAVRLAYALPLTAKAYVLLRKQTDDFTGETDAGAVAINGGLGNPEPFIDANFLLNGTLYYYKPYWTADGQTWHSEATRSVTPDGSCLPSEFDTLQFLRERLDSAMQYAISRGLLTHRNDAIQVLTASPSADDTAFPVVTLHLTADGSDVRGIGDSIQQDYRSSETSWQESGGWLSRVQIAVVGWSLNPDERSMLRRVLRDAVVANLDVFDEAGMLTVDFSQQDVEDFTSFNAPMYQTIGQFSCLAPVIVGNTIGVIAEVITSLNAGG